MRILRNPRGVICRNACELLTQSTLAQNHCYDRSQRNTALNSTVTFIGDEILFADKERRGLREYLDLSERK